MKPLKKFTQYYTDDKNKWEYWEAHRKCILSIIKDRIIDVQGNCDNVAIFGAGHCNDLDLFELSKLYNEILLLDKNTQHMEDGIKSQNLNKNSNSKISIIGGIDFCGITPTFYDDLERLLKDGVKYKNIQKFIRKEANNLSKPSLPLNHRNNFSTVISTAVHSQICIKAVALLGEYIDNYSRKEVLKLNDEIGYLYSKAVKIYNDLIISLANDSGSILFILDHSEISDISKNLKLLPILEQNLNEGKLTDNLVITQNCRVRGSIDCTKDIEKRKKNKAFVEDEEFIHQWLWRFENKKYYLVYAYTIKKGRLIS
ncbi:hypothetical protein SAMN02194393_05167 [Maledivibacter halophilus]|uniref:Methyltransferase domain-containing protein n=1 Tax=Maledivibacter halophilus TaxID=36842 RepID=A0A1T5MRC0_9FIRM|nr:hypothetical protein SAMN02194393_05167 [Maledivibacter halophilus]